MGIRYYTSSRNIRPNSLTCKRIHSRYARGQTLAEYALILAFISVVAIASLLSMGGQVSNVYSSVNVQLHDSANGGVSSRH